MIWPDARAYELKRSIRACIEETLPLQKIMMSSAYRECEGTLIDLEPLIRSSLPCSTSFEIFLLRASSAIQKKRGERGSPCLTPLLQ